ncbi:MAG TPA: 50S ribosomal protein L18Ae [Methanotrichaceae archaeon]|nr:50S ribosomal protein L18Ae [Methanotrichaceae archaeon]
MQFEIQGRFKAVVGRVWHPFSKIVESPNETNAREKAYSLMGSEHGIKRGLIKIDEVKSLGQ